MNCITIIRMGTCAVIFSLVARGDPPSSDRPPDEQAPAEAVDQPKPKERDGNALSIGVLLSTLDADVLQSLREAYESPGRPIPIVHGVYVWEAFYGSPAYEAGIQEGDIIYSVGSRAIEDIDGFFTATQDVGKSNRLTLKIRRPVERKPGKITWAIKRVRVTPVPFSKITELYGYKKWKESLLIEKATGGFRGVPWGASMKKVKESEKVEFSIEKDNLLAYKGEVAGLSALIGYTFIDDKMVLGKYLFMEQHANKNDCLSEYEQLKELMKKKYGDPDSDKIFWRNNLFRSSPDEWGTAVSIGHLVMLTGWKLADTNIGLILNGDNYEINLALEYSSTKKSKLAEKEQERRNADGL